MKLIPTPKKITETGETLDLCKISAVFVSEDVDSRVVKLASRLLREMEAVTGNKIRLSVGRASSGALHIAHGQEGEGYSLAVSGDGIELSGDGPQGAYYGIQTLRQLVRAYGKHIPCCEILDAPHFPERGFYHDVTRGRVPKIEMLKKIADQLAYCKINQLQLYVEDAYEFREYDGVMQPHEVLTAEDILELDAYCRENFIELVPSLSTFGHLYNLLQSDTYRHLCEYDAWQPRQLYWPEKMAHHTIDVSNEESIRVIRSMIDQFLPLFTSDRFNICCDETFDLCKGRNAGKDEGEEYFRFLKKIISHVQSRGKTVMMWGDIALLHPEKLSEIPEGTIMLNWTYDRYPDENKVRTMAEAGLTQLVCSGTSAWNRFVENIGTSEGNITRLARYGAKYGARGILNTNWGDFGHVAAWNCNLYGMALGAEMGWRVESGLGQEFEQAVSTYLYGADENVIPLIRAMAAAEDGCDWEKIVRHISAVTVEKKYVTFPFEPLWGRENILALEQIRRRVEILPGDVGQDLALACRAIVIENLVALALAGEKYAILRSEIESFIPDYRAAWLRDDKESQIDRLEAFLRELPDLVL